MDKEALRHYVERMVDEKLAWKIKQMPQNASPARPGAGAKRVLEQLQKDAAAKCEHCGKSMDKPESKKAHLAEQRALSEMKSGEDSVLRCMKAMIIFCVSLSNPVRSRPRCQHAKRYRHEHARSGSGSCIEAGQLKSHAQDWRDVGLKQVREHPSMTSTREFAAQQQDINGIPFSDEYLQIHWAMSENAVLQEETTRREEARRSTICHASNRKNLTQSTISWQCATSG